MAVTHTKAKKTPVTVTIDCTIPSDDKIMDVASLDKFLHDRVKIDGRTANLSAGHVTISRDGSKIVLVCAKGQKFPKKYIKYLIKKFLKKNQLRDWLRVVSKDRQTYELKYFNIAAPEEEEESENESDDEE